MVLYIVSIALSGVALLCSGFAIGVLLRIKRSGKGDD